MINSTQFIEKYYPDSNEVRKADVVRFVNCFNALTNDVAPSKVFKNKTLLCKSFYLSKTGNISRSHYQKIKGYLVNIMDFCGVSDGDIPTREEVIKSGEVDSYFRSIDSLLEFIDEVGYDKITAYNPTQDLVRVKAVCVLGWLGMSPEEISNLKNSDLQLIDLNGFRIQTSRGNFEIYGEPFAALYFLKGLVSYNALPVNHSRGRKITLNTDSEYLFRGQKNPNTERLDAEQVIQILRRFNMSVNGGKAIIFRNLYKNALFVEVYNDHSDKPLISKLMDTIECTYTAALHYKQQYLRFAEEMDSNQI